MTEQPIYEEFEQKDQLATSPWRMYMLICIVGLIITGILGYGFFTGDRMNRAYAPLIDAVMEIKLEATTAHLWLEEIISGDSFEDIGVVWQHHDRAEWYAQAMLEGGKSSEGTYIPLDDTQMRRKIKNVQGKLLEFREITQERINKKASSGIGTDIDQRYDHIFKSFLKEADEVETRLQQVMAKDLSSFRYTQVFLIVSSILLFLVNGIAFWRFDSQRVDNFLSLKEAKNALQKAHSELEIRVQERTAKLENANEQMKREIKERKAIEEALQESEFFIRAVMDNLPIGIAVNSVDPTVDFTYMNDNFPKFYRTNREALADPDNFWDSVYEDPVYREEIRKRVLDDCASDNPSRMHWEDVEITRKGEETIFLNARNTPIPDKQLMISTVWDTTNRKQAEEALRESEERYRLIAENVADVIWTMDMNLNFTYISPSICQQRGYSVEEAMAHSLDQVTMPDSLEKVMNLFAEKVSLVDSGDEEGFKSVDFEVEQPCKDGSVIWTSNNARILPGPDKQPASILGITRGITERKQWENSIKISRARFRQLFNDAPVIYVITEDRNQIPYINEVNRMFVSTLGYERQDVLGTPLANFYTDSSRRKLLGERGYQRALKGKFVAEERSLRTINGEVVHTVLHAKPEYDDEGRVIGTLATFLDITARKTAEKEAKRLEVMVAQAMKMETIGTLAGGISHDFNNILHMIVGNIELALDDVPEWNPAHSNLQEVKSASIRAAGIVKQLLTFSRKTDQELKPTKLSTVIQDALKLLRATIPTTIEIRKNIPDTNGTILADPIQINQVIMNLCINASHAMEETGGFLEISVENEILDEKTANSYTDLTKGDYIKITISDTGSGIDPEILGRLFDPYFTTKEVGKGSGMGLAVVQGIVNNHNGAITVDSEPGKGTTFTTLFPVATEKPEVEAKRTDEVPLGKETILFVDDEQAITYMTAQILKRLGYKVETETNPAAALELFQSKPGNFDLVITDMTMPQMTGVKLSEKLKDVRSDIPVIICTGHSSLIDEEKAKEIGIDGYVMKPIVKRDIAKIIRNVLDNKEHSSEG